jgi:hypothetical protein
MLCGKRVRLYYSQPNQEAEGYCYLEAGHTGECDHPRKTKPHSPRRTPTIECSCIDCKARRRHAEQEKIQKEETK